MNIIIINNAAKESTVLKAFLPIASKRYKNVCVVFPSRISSLLYTQEENVKICTPGVYQQIKAILRFIKRVFTKYTFIDIRLAKSQNKASLSFIMKYMKAIFMACIECCIVENELKFFKDDTYCVLRRRADTGAFASGHSAAATDSGLISHFPFNHYDIVFRYALEQ